MESAENEQTSPDGCANSAPLLVARNLVVAGLLISALIHVAITPEHLRDAPLLGIGFLAVAALQCAFGVIFARRPAPHLWTAALVLLVFSLATYVISRTLGLPCAHDHSSEAIGVIDVVAKGGELVALGGLLASIHVTTRNWPRGRSVRLAPFNRYAYLLALLLMGVIAALLLVHTGGHHALRDQRRDDSGQAQTVPSGWSPVPASPPFFVHIGPARDPSYSTTFSRSRKQVDVLLVPWRSNIRSMVYGHVSPGLIPAPSSCAHAI